MTSHENKELKVSEPVLLEMHALVGGTMNSKFSKINSAPPCAVLKISRSLCRHLLSVIVDLRKNVPKLRGIWIMTCMKVFNKNKHELKNDVSFTHFVNFLV